MKKKIIIVIVTLVFLGIVFYIVDYSRIKAGMKPLFMIAELNKEGPTVNYIGLGYRLERTPSISYKEELYMDAQVKFGSLFWTKKININKPMIDYLYTLKPTFNKSKEQLYKKGKNRNYYTYNIKNISYEDNKQKAELKDTLENTTNIEGLIKNFKTIKTYKDNSIMYVSTNISSVSIKILMCETKKENKDVYIGDATLEYKESYCK
ncbi:MAG: hypothetical protein RSA91_04820 [Bacilli bacterium]